MPSLLSSCFLALLTREGNAKRLGKFRCTIKASMSQNAPNLKLIAVFAVPLLFVTALLQASKRYVDVLDGGEDLEALIARAKAAGYPFKASEIATKNVPDSNNGYIPLKKLFLVTENRPPKLPADIFEEKHLNDPNRPAAVVELVERAKKVAAKTQFKADHDYDQPYEDYYPEFTATKDVVKALSFDAQFMARHGQVEKSLQSLRLARNVPLQLSEDPSRIGMLVSVALQQIYYAAVCRVAYELRHNKGALTHLQQLTNDAIPVSTATQNFHHDFYYSLAILRNFKSNAVIAVAGGFEEVPENSELASQVVREGLPKSSINRALLAKMIRRHLEFDAIRAKHPDPAEASKAMDALVADSQQTISEAVIGVMAPLYSQSDLSRNKVGVYQEFARWSIQILLDHPNGLPESLPPRPDKNLGGTLHYMKKDVGFFVYSTGGDKTDSGGPVDEQNWDRGDDFGLYVTVQVQPKKPAPSVPGAPPAGSRPM